MLKSDLERSLIEHIESFLLELGRGFMFVGSQYRISIDGVNYYVDMVFYNKILHAYLLIDLKMGKLRPENYGQMNMYLNYFNNETKMKNESLIEKRRKELLKKFTENEKKTEKKS